MPFSELFMFSKEKADSSQKLTSNLPSDVSFQGHSDCCELVCDQGHQTMLNQSSKERKGFSSLPSIVSKHAKLKLSSMDSILNDFPLSAPSYEMNFDEDDNSVPWDGCSVMEPFNDIYSPNMLLKNKNAGQADGSSGLQNFSYFARLASNCKQTNMESTFVNSSAGFCHQDSAFNAKTDRILPGPGVASSSVCSGNGLGRDSNNNASSLKRKCFEAGDSEGPSTDDADDELIGVRNASNRSASKRSRVAEVHNQSERRRRERINEKMRALQELIPNCNKVDKASMLDEAIDYLKALQLQVQILSMGSGMYMSQMMLPPAMQHMYRAHMSQFLPMGMGAPFGFGMNMPDMNNMMQMPSYIPLSGPPSGYNGASSSSSQVLGHFGQGMRLPMANVSGMPLANNSMDNQGTMAVNEAENATGLSSKHSC